jgi:hypothetical protein
MGKTVETNMEGDGGGNRWVVIASVGWLATKGRRGEGDGGRGGRRRWWTVQIL